jgi:hypothetical protein
MNYNWRRRLVLATAGLLCLAGPAGASPGANYGPGLAAGNAHLIVYRIPTIGRRVIVHVYVDDVVVGTIPYGATYRGFLKPGYHVLSVLATPDPTWLERPPTIVSVRAGQRYHFTAMGNGAENLILRPTD